MPVVQNKQSTAQSKFCWGFFVHAEISTERQFMWFCITST